MLEGKQKAYRKIILLLISMSSSMVNSLPLIGSTPLSVMYFSIIRLSKIAPDDGETTGCSGTSLETETVFLRLGAATFL